MREAGERGGTERRGADEIAGRGELADQLLQEGLALLHRGHELGIDLGKVRRVLDHLLVHVAEPEALGGEVADLLAEGAVRLRDANHLGGHAARIDRQRRPGKTVGLAAGNDAGPACVVRAPDAAEGSVADQLPEPVPVEPGPLFEPPKLVEPEPLLEPEPFVVLGPDAQPSFH